jgi:hypothetical protein
MYISGTGMATSIVMLDGALIKDNILASGFGNGYQSVDEIVLFMGTTAVLTNVEFTGNGGKAFSAQNINTVIVNGQFRDNTLGCFFENGGKAYGINLLSYSNDRQTSDADHTTGLGTIGTSDEIELYLINITSIGRLFARLGGSGTVTISNSILWGRDDYAISTDPAKETLGMRVTNHWTGNTNGMVSVTKSLVKNAPSASISVTSYTANNANTVTTVSSFPTVTVGNASGVASPKKLDYTFTALYPYTNYPSGWTWAGKETSIFNSYGGKDFSLGSGSPAKDQGDNSNYPLSSTGLGSDTAAKTEAAAYFNTTHGLNLPDAALEQLGKALRKDAAGNPRRPLAGTIDMGAFEY